MKNMQNFLKQLDPTWVSSALCLIHETLIYAWFVFIIANQFLKRFHDKEAIDQLLSHPNSQNIKSFYSNRKEFKIEFKDNDMLKENSP